MIVLKDGFLTLEKPVTGYLPCNIHEHLLLADKLHDYKLSSVIVLKNHLEERLFTNPTFTKKSYYVKRMPVDEPFKFEFDPIVDRAIDGQLEKPDDLDDETNRKFNDAVIEGKMTYSRLINLFEEFNEITGKARKKRNAMRQKKMIEMCTPTIGTEYERIYPMDDCLSNVVYKNGWLQFYVAENETECLIGNGYSSGSLGREHQGLIAHAFASLTLEGKAIPTKVCILTDQNTWSEVNCYDTFKAIGYDLTGNYKASYENIASIFKNMLVYPTMGKDFKYTGITEKDPN